MLVRVRKGPLAGVGADVGRSAGGYLEGKGQPTGQEIWTGEVENINATSLRQVNVGIEPGEWYTFPDFKAAVEGVVADSRQSVMSAVTMEQPGVSRSWSSTIEVHESAAALMMCRAVIGYVEDLGPEDAWFRVE